jgi:hypothetical protein
MKPLRCHVSNTACIGQYCGYGEGATWNAAVADCLRKHPDGTYDPRRRAVVVHRHPIL